ncbi:MAG: FkbM family methyltransferase [Rhodospirillaceae bacterium]|nr:FkbM family methyltransferase [Rhodospirillaceae bacterium]MBT7613820.1 FkbM family methyltransferase [Rhodospirillaceae bacterium]
MLYNRNDRFIGRSLELLGEFSPGEGRFFQTTIKPGDTVIEVGAQMGAHTVGMAKAVGPEGRVHAFEPQRIMFQLLCANLALNGLLNTFAWNMAADEQPGTLFVPELDYEKSENFGGVALHRDNGVGQEVPAVALDRFMAKKGLGKAGLSFIKIDVEGMELPVLKGAAGLIAAQRPMIYFENDRRDKSEALLRWMLEAGYKLFWHVTPYFKKENYYGLKEDPFAVGEGQTIISANVLAVPSEKPVSGLDSIQIHDPTNWWSQEG